MEIRGKVIEIGCDVSLQVKSGGEVCIRGLTVEQIREFGKNFMSEVVLTLTSASEPVADPHMLEDMRRVHLGAKS